MTLGSNGGAGLLLCPCLAGLIGFWDSGFRLRCKEYMYMKCLDMMRERCLVSLSGHVRCSLDYRIDRVVPSSG